MAALAFRALSGFLGPVSFGKDKVAITASGRDNAQVAGSLQLFEVAVDLPFGLAYLFGQNTDGELPAFKEPQ